MKTVASLLLFAFQATLGSSFVLKPQASGCSIVIRNLDPEAVVVSDLTNDFLYADPNSESTNLKSNETIVISCPGGTLTAGTISSKTAISATCVSNTQFTSNGKTFDFNKITCSRKPFHTARYTGEVCENEGKEIEVGFVLDDERFARQIIICFDEAQQIALYSTYFLTKSIGHHESGVPRPSFIQDNFYSIGSVNSLYVRGGQRETINALLGLPKTSTKYIEDSTDYFLARGHFTAKADFVYAPQQDATFHYVNAAPQWQTFNGGNWETVESDVRAFAELNGLDLIVYTGGYGVTTLPHATTGKDVPLYLYVNGGTKALPVPELYWKVVYDPASKAGVVLLGLNNPYQLDLTRSVICNDISPSLDWLTWDPTNLELGFSYACTVEDFRKTVTYLPEFEVAGVLA